MKKKIHKFALIIILSLVTISSYLYLKAPLVSIVMPVYNGEKYLEQTIGFLLQSTFSDFEFIVIDDGSTDNSYQKLQELAKTDRRIKVFKNPQNMGISKTRNRGFELARGKYIAPMDQDDWSLPERLDLSVKYLEEHKEVDVVGVGTILMNDYYKGIKTERMGAITYLIGDNDTEEKLYTIDERDENIKISLFFSLAVPTQSASMMRKSFLEQHKIFYREGIKYADDYALYVDMIKKGARFHHIKDILHVYNDVREHSASFSQEQYDETMKIKKELLEYNNLSYNQYSNMEIEEFICSILKDLQKTNLEHKHFSQELLVKNYNLLCEKAKIKK